MTSDFNIMLTEPDGYSSEALGIYQALGEVELGPFNRREILERVGRIHVIVIRLGYQIDNEVICRGKKLQIIVSPTTGLDHIDMEAAERQKIEVISLKGETEFLRGIPATAELSWGLLLAAMRQIPAAAFSASKGVWDRDQFIGQDLKGKMLGIIGLGRIGEKVASYGLAFGMNVEAWDPYRDGWMQGVKKADSLESLLANCNVLMVHVPLKPETLDLIGKKQFEAIKPGTVLVNTSRGGIVNEDELIKALERRTISAAALDVIQAEVERKKVITSPLVDYAKSHMNLLLTPHIGGATVESMHATELYLAEKLKVKILARQAL